MYKWIDIALKPTIVIRSIRVAIIVGTILVLINYVDRIIYANLEMMDYLKMALTYCVPYCVSTYAAVSTIISKEEGGGNETL